MECNERNRVMKQKMSEQYFNSWDVSMCIINDFLFVELWFIRFKSNGCYSSSAEEAVRDENIVVHKQRNYGRIETIVLKCVSKILRQRNGTFQKLGSYVKW